MSNQPGTETFRPRDDFLDIYVSLLKKHTFNPRDEWNDLSWSASDLVKDLCNKLGSCAVALVVKNDRSHCTTVVAHFAPQKYAEQYERLIQREDILDKLSSVMEKEGDSGTTIDSRNVSKNGQLERPYFEMDAIFAPRISSTEDPKALPYIFLIVNPVALTTTANGDAGRYIERLMIAQFLRDWWVRMMTSVALPQIFTTGDVQSNGTSETSSRLSKYQVATLSELIQFGNACARDIRFLNQPADICFPNVKHEDIFWNNWTPRLPTSLWDKSNLLGEYRERCRSLLYWSRWTHAQHHLEEELNSPLHHRGANTKQNALPVAGWVKKQRDEPDYIRKRLDDLRNYTAQYFIHGDITPIEPVGDSALSRDISIHKQSMLSFGFNKWCEGMLQEGIGNASLNDEGFCRLMHGAAVTIQYVLGNQNLTEDVINRLTQLIARYAHANLGVPRRIDLRSHLLQAARGELALHTLKPYYRDHFFHSLEVCFLGHILLETKLNTDQYLWQLVAESMRVSGDKTQVLRQWYLASLIHDIGYAMDVLDRSSKYFDYFKHSASLRFISESVKQATKKLVEYEKDEQHIFNIHNLDVTVAQDHGIIGALHLQSLLEKICIDSDYKAEVYQPAVQAIALHNLKRRGDVISFSERPLAFLLALCDQIQEWRRPRLAFSESPGQLLAALNGSSLNPANFEGALKSMRMNLCAKSNEAGGIDFECYESTTVPVITFTTEYDDRINHNNGVADLWLSGTMNFQRFNFDGLPLDINVTYVTPYSHSNDDRPKRPELDRLKDAAHDTHMTFLEEWFPTKLERYGDITRWTNEAIVYQKDDINEKETLTLNLRALAGKAWVTRDMAAFREHIKEWKHYNDDRDFLGDYAAFTPE